MARLVMNLSHPTDKFFGIGDSSGKEDESYFVWEENYALLPHNASLLVPHVVHLVVYNPSNFSHHLRSPNIDSDSDIDINIDRDGDIDISIDIDIDRNIYIYIDIDIDGVGKREG
jgi:hypothetical protein